MATIKVPNPSDYKERSTRALLTWTPSQTRAAYSAAEAGHLMRASDLVDAALEDDRVSGTLGTRVRGLLGLPTYLEPPNDQTPTDSPLMQAFETDFLRAYPEPVLEELITWGLTLGVGLGEQRWAKADGRLVPFLRVWSPRWLRYDEGAGVWMLTTSNAGEIPVEPDDPRWLLYMPYGSHRPWRRALFRSVGLWWLLKRYAIQDWATYGEAHGNPVRAGLAPEGASKTDRAELAADLADMSGVSGIALPPGYDVKLVEATANTWQTFQGQIKQADAGIAVAVLGQTLTTEVTGGSLAAAKVHDIVRHDLLESDEAGASTILHQGGARYWALFNYGDAELAPWWRWETEPPTDEKAKADTQQARATALSSVANVIATYAQMGLELDLQKLAADFDIPFANVQALSEAVQQRGGIVTLANALPDEKVAGFVRGQLYVDRLAKRAAGLKPFQKTLDQVNRVIQDAGNLEEVQTKLLELFDQLDPDDVSPLVETLMMSDLAGRAAVLEDL